MQAASPFQYPIGKLSRPAADGISAARSPAPAVSRPGSNRLSNAIPATAARPAARPPAHEPELDGREASTARTKRPR